MIWAILVIYNRSVLSSPTYTFINKHSKIHLVVYDNSTIATENESIVCNDGHIYLTNHTNIGLSKAYNKALDTILSKDRQGYVILLDDDTILNEEYMKQLSCFHGDIGLPIVQDEISILSPSKVKNDIIYRTKDLSLLSQDTITGINTGMVINLSCFQDYRYNENLFLDYVDHNFIRTMKQRKKKIEIMNCTIHQNFSSNSQDKKAILSRFQIFQKDSHQYYQNKLILFFVLFKRKLKLTIQFRDIRILFM